MKIKNLSLDELIKLAEKADSWERLPDKYDSDSSPNMFDDYTLDYEYTTSSYEGRIREVQIRVSYKRGKSYSGFGESTSHEHYGISAVLEGVNLGEHTANKIKKIYESVETAYKQRKKEEIENKERSAIEKARNLLN